MLCHGLSCTETARNSSSAALCDREQGVKDSLTGNKWNACRVAELCRPWDTDRPFLGECQISGCSVVQLDSYDWFQDRVIAIRNSFDNSSTRDIRRNHGFVKDRSSFLCFCNDRARLDDIALLYGHMDGPFLLGVERVYADTTGDIFAGRFCNLFQWTLDTVKNIVDDTRSEKNRDGIAGAGNSLARTETGGLLKNLNGGHALFESDDFAYQVVFADIDHLGDLEAGIAFQIDDGTVDTVNNTCFIHDSVLRQI